MKSNESKNWVFKKVCKQCLKPWNIITDAHCNKFDGLMLLNASMIIKWRPVLWIANVLGMHLGEWMRKHVHTYMYSSNSETIKKYFNTHFYLEVFSRILELRKGKFIASIVLVLSFLIYVGATPKRKGKHSLIRYINLTMFWFVSSYIYLL